MSTISGILPLQHLNARRKQYAANMPKRVEISTKEVIARNLRALMRRHGLNQPKLAKLSGVSQRHISSILRAEAEPGAEKLDKLARPFKLKGWQLQVPDIPEDLLDSDVIEKLMRALRELSPEGREHLAQNAEREVFFDKNRS